MNILLSSGLSSIFSPQVVLLLFVIIILFAVFAFFKMKNIPAEKEGEKLLYRVRKSIFTQSEATFFQELTRQLPEGYYIFPKMRLADIMETTATGREYMGQVNRILKKHVDFLICDQNYKPVLAIELNGSSHQTVRAQKSDEFKKNAFENIGLRFEVVQVESGFASEIASILRRLNP